MRLTLVGVKEVCMQAHTRLEREKRNIAPWILLEADIEQIAFHGPSFQHITCSASLPYLQDLPKFFSKARTWLSQGGSLVFNTPEVVAIWSWTLSQGHPHRPLSHSTCQQTIAEYRRGSVGPLECISDLYLHSICRSRWHFLPQSCSWHANCSLCLDQSNIALGCRNHIQFWSLSYFQSFKTLIFQLSILVPR